MYRPLDYVNYKVPTQATSGSAGWDLYCAETVILKPLVPTLVPTFLEVAIPDGHMLLVLPRSSLAYKKNLLIPNSPGLIDADYRGHLQVILSWMPSEDTVPQQQLEIKQGERIAQAVLVPYVHQSWIEVDELPPTTRSKGGFGSTGT